MAQLSYREAVAAGIAQEMRRDDAVVFIGEDVAAAVVLQDGKSADEAELRGFASDRLARFKVPRRILIIDEIPKGATGKLQRIGLAEKLGIQS